MRYVIAIVIICVFGLGFTTGANMRIVTGVGSNVNANSTSTITGPSFYIKRFRVTAYCPCPKCCGIYADGVTANGHKIQPGDKFVAAPKGFAFGTRMSIPGYGDVTVKDRGGAIKGDRLDVFFNTHQEALNWGVKYLNVKVYE